MSWKRLSNRDFLLESKATPKEVGPGRYDPELLDWRFPHEIRHQSGLKRPPPPYPSPGDYEPEIYDARIPTSSPFQSRTKRKVFTTNDNPSPDEYNLSHSWTSAKGTDLSISGSSPLQNRSSFSSTIPKRAKITSNRPTPFVGQKTVSCYDISEDGGLHPLYAVKRGPELIGPGSYDPEDQSITRAHYMNESLKVPPNNETLAPGPGRYSPTISRNSLGGSIYERHASAGAEPFKGGNLLHPEWNPSGKPTSSFVSRATRNVFEGKIDTPDPTTYSRQRSYNIPESKTPFGFNQNRFSDSNNEVPGPGAYNVRIGNSRRIPPGFPHSQSDSRSVSDVPGPGQYDVPYTSSPELSYFGERPSSVFASGTFRSGKIGNEVPGPGSYDPRLTNSTGGAEIFETRYEKYGNFSVVPSAENPSPDQYYLLKNPSHGITISKLGRVPEPPNGFPGPGTYEVTHESLLPKSYHVDCANMS